MMIFLFKNVFNPIWPKNFHGGIFRKIVTFEGIKKNIFDVIFNDWTLIWLVNLGNKKIKFYLYANFGTKTQYSSSLFLPLKTKW